MLGPLDARELERVYADYLVSCETRGLRPIPRERALQLLEQWTEALSRGPEPPAYESSTPLAHGRSYYQEANGLQFRGRHH